MLYRYLNERISSICGRACSSNVAAFSFFQVVLDILPLNIRLFFSNNGYHFDARFQLVLI
jgi:hypothetical protein